MIQNKKYQKLVEQIKDSQFIIDDNDDYIIISFFDRLDSIEFYNHLKSMYINENINYLVNKSPQYILYIFSKKTDEFYIFPILDKGLFGNWCFSNILIDENNKKINLNKLNINHNKITNYFKLIPILSKCNYVTDEIIDSFKHCLFILDELYNKFTIKLSDDWSSISHFDIEFKRYEIIEYYCMKNLMDNLLNILNKIQNTNIKCFSLHFYMKNIYNINHKLTKYYCNIDIFSDLANNGIKILIDDSRIIKNDFIAHLDFNYYNNIYPNFIDDYINENLMNCAIGFGNVNLINYLISKGININNIEINDKDNAYYKLITEIKPSILYYNYLNNLGFDFNIEKIINISNQTNKYHSIIKSLIKIGIKIPNDKLKYLSKSNMELYNKFNILELEK